MENRLDRSFFARPTLDVAKDLLGKELVFNDHRGVINETEAYIGQDDPACHAAKGKTKRTEVMFGKPGFSYVYLIYGMYYCLNFVTEEEGFPAAVLIRGLYMPDQPKLDLQGPGKLCRHLEITKEDNAIDITEENRFYVADTDTKPAFKATPRIGISQGQEKLWRFICRV